MCFRRRPVAFEVQGNCHERPPLGCSCYLDIMRRMGESSTFHSGESDRACPSAPGPLARAHRERPSMTMIRHDWTRAEVLALHDQPLSDLLFEAQTVLR